MSPKPSLRTNAAIVVSPFGLRPQPAISAARQCIQVDVLNRAPGEKPVDRDGVVRALAVLHKLMAHVESTGDHRDGTATGIEMHQTLSLLIADFEAEASRLSVETVAPAMDVATDAVVAETASQGKAEAETNRVPPRTPQQ